MPISHYRVRGVLRDNGAAKVFTVAAESPEEAEAFANEAGLYVSDVVPSTAQEEAAIARPTPRSSRNKRSSRKSPSSSVVGIVAGVLLLIAFESVDCGGGGGGGSKVDLGNGYEADLSAVQNFAREQGITEAEAHRVLSEAAAMKEAARVVKERQR